MTLFDTILLLAPGVVLSVLLVLHFAARRRRDGRQAYQIRLLCALVPLLLCLSRCMVYGYRVYWLIFTALACFFIGDAAMLLGPWLSAFFRLAGHGVILVAFFLMKPSFLWVILFGGLLLLTVLLFRGKWRRISKLSPAARLFGGIYGFLAIAAAAMGPGLPFLPGTACMAVAAVLLYVSDLLTGAGRLAGTIFTTEGAGVETVTTPRVGETVFLYAALYAFAMSVWL